MGKRTISEKEQVLTWLRGQERTARFIQGEVAQKLHSELPESSFAKFLSLLAFQHVSLCSRFGASSLDDVENKIRIAKVFALLPMVSVKK